MGDEVSCLGPMWKNKKKEYNNNNDSNNNNAMSLVSQAALHVYMKSCCAGTDKP